MIPYILGMKCVNIELQKCRVNILMKKEDHDLMLQNLDLYKMAVKWRCVCRKTWLPIQYKHLIENTKALYWNNVFRVANFNFQEKNDEDAYENMAYQISQLSFADFEIFHNMLRIANNRSMQRYRLRKVFNSWFDKNYQVCLITLNPAPDFLSLSDSTRRKYISKFLSDRCLDFFCNVDYSPKTGREHWHACCVLENASYHKTYVKNGIQQFEFDDFPYGWSNIQFIYNPDSSRITDYVNKLVNHSIKASTGQTKNIMRKRVKKA